jgi:NAD+ diphosphatase
VTVPALSRSAADRAAGHRDDADWLAAAWQSGSLLVVDDQSRASVMDDGPSLVLVESGSWPDGGERYLLGVGDGTAYWGTIGELPRRLGARPLGLRDVGAGLDDLESGLLVATIALANWHRTHPRCPRCGALTRIEQAGWSRRCDVDGSQHFPRTDPAVIVLLHDGGDRALLGRQPTWPAGRYSTIAGFVEAGESAEHAVTREVREETGVEVDDVIYCGSQPWPFPQSLMLGYEARVVGGTVDNVDKELEDVRWFTREELRGGDPLLPPNASIASWLIRTWLDRPAGRS